MKSTIALVIFLMTFYACLDKKPVLDGHYDFVSVIFTESGGSKTTPVSGQLQLGNNDYNLTMTDQNETFNAKGRFSVNGSRLTLESISIDGEEEYRLSKMDQDQLTFDTVFTQKDRVLYLELILGGDDVPYSWKLVFMKK